VQRVACKEKPISARKHDLQLFQAGLKPVQERWLSYQVIDEPCARAHLGGHGLESRDFGLVVAKTSAAILFLFLRAALIFLRTLLISSLQDFVGDRRTGGGL
jgi:hypothetical protein